MSNDAETTPARAPAGCRVVLVAEFIGDRSFDGSGEITDLVPAAIDGDLSMRILESSIEEVSGAQLALLAIAQGSDPDFVGVDEHGRPTDYDGDGADAPPPGDIHNCGHADVVCDLMRQRGCTILDREAVSAALVGNAGPLYHDGHDIDELGRTWSQRGEPWLSAIERELVSLSAITPPTRPGTPPRCEAAPEAPDH